MSIRRTIHITEFDRCATSKVSVVQKMLGTVAHRTSDLYGINDGLRRLRAGLAAEKLLGQVTDGGLIRP